MCLVLYLGSAKQRPLIAWDESTPRFHVKDNDEDAQKSAQHLSKQFIYYVGSDNGCGCGFRREDAEWIEDKEQLASIADNQRRLHDYVSTCLRDEDSVELYSCWSGDESLPKEHDRTITLADLLDNSFWFAERQRSVVQRTE